MELNVDLLFVSGQYKILELGAASILKAKLPNPSYLEGSVGGYYSILGGKVRGHCRFNMKLGEQCEVDEGGSVVSGLEVIAEVSPKEGEKEVSVFVNPQAAFNLALNKGIEMEDLDGKVKTFRAKLGHFKLYSEGQELPGNIIWDALGEVASFETHDVFPSNKPMKVSVRVFFEENINGAWQPVMIKGNQAEEIKEISFTSGTAPDYIPQSNVAYSYPVINQYNFYKSEYPSGYIKLKKGQPELFLADPRWKRTGRLINDKGAEEISVAYREAEKTVSFDIPSSLENEKIQTFHLVNIPLKQAGAVGENVQNIEADSNQTVSMADKNIETVREVLQEKIFYEQNFRTSKYSTFREKISAWGMTSGWSSPISGYNGLHQIGVTVTADELLDKNELADPLVLMAAQLNNKWFEKEINPLIYKPYPINGTNVSWRDTSALGLPPVRAIEMQQANREMILTPGDVSANNATALPGNGQIVYDLPFYMYKDYEDLRQKIANMSISNDVNSDAYRILYTPFPGISSGKYDVNLMYTLPGIRKVTSVFPVTIKNP